MLKTGLAERTDDDDNDAPDLKLATALLWPHADRHAGDISFTVLCNFLCLSADIL